MADNTAGKKDTGKFSIYVRNEELRRKITAIARFDRVSITQLISGILENYADTRADDIAVILRQDAEIDALKQQADTPETGNPTPDTADTADTEGQTSEPEQPAPRNPNWAF